MASQASRPFGTEARILACNNCGAPLEVPPQGGRVPCSYCSFTSVIGKRPTRSCRLPDPVADHLSPAERDKARLASLWRQQRDYSHTVGSYNYCNAPDDLQHLDDMSLDHPDLAAQAHTAFRQAFARCEASGCSFEDQRRLWWITQRTHNAWIAKAEPLRARAYVESAIEVLSDAGFLHLLTCNLAGYARREGDLDAAADWLALCDPASPTLELDSAYRYEKATLALIRNEEQQVLELLGIAFGSIPVIHAKRPLIALTRIAALANLGRTGEAVADLQKLRDWADANVGDWHLIFPLILANNAQFAPCKALLERLQLAERRKLEAQHKLTRRKKLLLFALAAVAIAVVIALWYFLSR